MTPEIAFRAKLLLEDLFGRPGDITTTELELELAKHRLVLIDRDGTHYTDADIDRAYAQGADALLEVARTRAVEMRHGLQAAEDAITLGALEEAHGELFEGE